VTLTASGLLGASTRTTLFEAAGAKAALYALIVAGFALMLTAEERTKAWRLAGHLRPR
jgi:hypothetical protein